MNRQHPQPRHPSRHHVDDSGGKLPAIPVSKELAEALEAEASRNFRSPRDHALRILEHYFWLNVAPDDRSAHDAYWNTGTVPEPQGPRARSPKKRKPSA